MWELWCCQQQSVGLKRGHDTCTLELGTRHIIAYTDREGG